MCWATPGVGVKRPDLLSRTAKSASELTFLEAEPQRESVRTYKVGPPANTSGHGIYMQIWVSQIGIWWKQNVRPFFCKTCQYMVILM